MEKIIKKIRIAASKKSTKEIIKLKLFSFLPLFPLRSFKSWVRKRQEIQIKVSDKLTLFLRLTLI